MKKEERREEKGNLGEVKENERGKRGSVEGK